MNPSEVYRAASANPDGAASGADDPRVLQAVEEYLAALEAGQAPGREEFLERHADIAPRLGEYLDGLELIHRAGSAAGPESAANAAADDLAGAEPLGDFLLVRELGRGGMGVVYEAVQRSLNRRVALKVLPFAAALDAKQLQRFKNEAQAAACLHHPHIVPVFGVGCERGVHYYAMQLIEGHTLAAVIDALRDPPAAAAAAASTAKAVFSTERDSGRSRPFFHAAARLGIAAAEALEHAHQVGVVHRDIKPGNLLLDAAGTLWVTDFGLARIGTQAGLTLSGDLVGTLRYMSPEQALAQRTIDHRTDLYALGATLYELLTLRPVVVGNDRQELLRQIAVEEPVPPRRLNRAIPAELETVVLKALEKNPADRYATAQELADDLNRFLKDEPIRARRPTLLQRARKWGRRHRPIVAATAVVLALALVLLGGAGGWLAQRRLAVETEALGALAEAEAWQRQGRWPEARGAARRAEGLLTGAGGRAEVRQRVNELLDDLAMLEQLEEIRLEQSQVKDNRFDIAGADAAYAQAFRGYGLDVEVLGPGAGALIRTRSIAVQLAAALDDWALARQQAKAEADGSWKQLLAVARAADADPFRTQVRQAVEAQDRAALQELADGVAGTDLPATTLILLSKALEDRGDAARALALVRAGQRRYPGDFWLTQELARLLASDPSQLHEALRFCTAAVALRPQCPVVYGNLGNALRDQRRRDEAVAAYRTAIELNPDYLTAYDNLAGVLFDQGRRDEAMAVSRQVLERKPDDPRALTSLGGQLRILGRRDEAVVMLRHAIKVEPDNMAAYISLGYALGAKGDLYDAALRKGIEADPDSPMAYWSLGRDLKNQGRWDEAAAAFRKAIERKRDFAEALKSLGEVFKTQGKFAEALVHYRRSQAVGSRSFGPRYASYQCRECEELVELDRKLSAIMKGEVLPSDAAERLRLAFICGTPARQLHATAVRLSAEAFAADPSLAFKTASSHRYDAACDAVQAGCGQGKDAADLDEQEYKRLRLQALSWLRADLAAWRNLLEKEPNGPGLGTVRKMQHWLADRDLAGVRSPEGLALLPEAEQQTWRQFWGEVQQLLDRAQAIHPKAPGDMEKALLGRQR